MTVFRTYVGTKMIHARPQNLNGDDGYEVEYQDGYKSWSPKAAFEEAYRSIEDGHMGFGHALELLEQGFSVARAEWMERGEYIYLVGAGRYLPTTDAGDIIASDEEDGLVPYAPYIAMKTAREDVVPWTASHSDLLCDDWLVLFLATEDE